MTNKGGRIGKVLKLASSIQRAIQKVNLQNNNSKFGDIENNKFGENYLCGDCKVPTMSTHLHSHMESK